MTITSTRRTKILLRKSNFLLSKNLKAQNIYLNSSTSCTSETRGNSVISFSRTEDIETHLLKQWGALFQKLLRERRDHAHEARRVFTISEQIEDIKTAIISTIGNAQSRDVARSVIKYRRLSDFLSGLNFPDFAIVTDGTFGFEELLETAGIVKVRDIPDSRGSFGRVALIKEDGSFYELRMSQEFISRVAIDWASFITLTPEIRQIVFEAISDMGRMGPGLLRYRSEPFETYFAEQLEKEDTSEVSITDLIRDEPIQATEG